MLYVNAANHFRLDSLTFIAATIRLSHLLNLTLNPAHQE